MKVKKKIILTLLIRGQFSYSKAKTRRIAPNTGNKYNESDISLDFHVVFGMDRPNAIVLLGLKMVSI